MPLFARFQPQRRTDNVATAAARAAARPRISDSLPDPTMPTHPARHSRFATPAQTRSGSRARQWGRLGKPVIALLALSVLSGAATAITYFITQPRTAEPALAAVPPPPTPLFYSADPFTVTLDSSDGERMLHVGLTFKLAEESARQRLDTYLPVVRSQLLLLLAAQDAGQVQSSEGKRRLAEAVQTTVNAVFDDRAQPPVQSVLFNAFVVQ